MNIKNISKCYKKYNKIIVYDKTFNANPPTCNLHSKINCSICFPRSKNPIPSDSSISRTKTKIKDYCLLNDFDLFCTFTFNPKKVDSFSRDIAVKKLSKWLNNARQHSPDLKFLFIPEYHESKRIHFHGFLKNYNGILIDSHLTTNSRKIYNLSNWRYGFSTVVKIDNIEIVSNYVTKYITKNMIFIGNKKRYFCSRNLNIPTKQYNVDLNLELFSKPLFILNEFSKSHKRIDLKTGEIITYDSHKIYTVAKI